MTRPTLIKNAHLIDPAKNKVEPGAILFADKILDIGNISSAPDGAEIIDGDGAHVAPGLIDMRVVIGEPGAEHKETFKSAGRAAAAGGVTTMVMMPNTTPVLDDQSLIDFVLRRGIDRSGGVRILPAAALTQHLDGELMTEIGLMAEAGAVLFTNGDKPIVSGRTLRRALSYATTFDALIAHRPEDPYLAEGGVMHEGELAARLGLPGIPAAAELIMAERDLTLAELTGGRLLLDMISSAQTLPSLKRAKAKGVKAYASVNVHHLVLNENDVDGYRTFAKLSPPLRSEDDRVALVHAVNDGLIDVIVSGHDPRPAEDKRLPYEEAAFGAVGLETLLPGALTLHHKGDVALTTLFHAMTQRPAELLKLPQGRLAKHAPADIILIDLGAPFRLDSDKLRSKSNNSPFDEKLLQGAVKRTFIAGKSVFGG
ncbi:dihydroorotase [Candidatus Viadribacter manganicus]|uniref:Dihydroorotase n=1 Tax=Candidatus Viadribacter manganicus TaxID=1759059 RepID=A0A1B1AM56_9PROT|nr:dihydroorotase [Candidatus Viadribacter manganicus]ANP47634.1 dihydroorotase [Candidatus Viadribacter manganicus]